MDIATGEVLTNYKPRHRNVLDDLEIHLVADNRAAHYHDNVTRWLEYASRRDGGTSAPHRHRHHG